jgi:hypothetical protein
VTRGASARGRAPDELDEVQHVRVRVADLVSVSNAPQHDVGLSLHAAERPAVHRQRQLARRLLKTHENMLDELPVDQVELGLLVRYLDGMQQLGC